MTPPAHFRPEILPKWSGRGDPNRCQISNLGTGSHLLAPGNGPLGKSQLLSWDPENTACPKSIWTEFITELGPKFWTEFVNRQALQKNSVPTFGPRATIRAAFGEDPGRFRALQSHPRTGSCEEKLGFRRASGSVMGASWAVVRVLGASGVVSETIRKHIGAIWGLCWAVWNAPGSS